MKAIRIFLRSIRDAFKSVGRNFSLSMASILCVTITLIIVSVSMVLAYNINNATKNIEDEMSIIAYLKEGVSEKDIDNIKADISSMDGIKKIAYLSKEAAKQEMIEYGGAFSVILNYLDTNPLLDSFTVYVDDVKEISNIAKEIEKIDKIETIKYGEGMVEEIVKAFDIIQKITIGIVVALVLVTIFLIGNTIKLTIYSRKSEIEIMRLVGASNTTIKMPFLFEGLIIGILGSIIPICITIYGYVILYNALKGHLFSEMLLLVKPFNFVFQISGFLLLIGSIVGMYGSLNAVRKYLKI